MLKVRGILIICFLLFFKGFVVFSQSVDDYKEKIQKYKSENNKIELANAYKNLGNLYWQSGNLNNAAENFTEAINLNKDLGNTNAQRILNGFLGLVYLEKEEYLNAIGAFEKSLALNKKAGKVQEIISDQNNIATAYQYMGQYNKSNEYAKLSLAKSLEINNLASTKSCYLILAENSDKLGDKKASAEYYDKYNTINKHLQQKQLVQLESEKQRIASERQQAVKEKKIIESEKEQVEEELKSQEGKIQEVTEEMKLQQQLNDMQLQSERELHNTQMRYFLIVIALILGILIIFFLQSRHRKKINQRLNKQNIEIEKQKVEIEKQRDLADKQRKNLTDSIQYARRIQSAVIPRPETLLSHFKDSFILYKPKDIVSGDFYWYAQKDNLFIIAAADCTGHGVPGAFMSMLGVAYLNEIVNKVAVNIHINSLNADEILNQLREKVISSLHQSDNKRDPKDGMDIGLCVIDMKKKKLQFAGAYNPLLIIRDNEIMKFKGDKMPVSYHRRRNVPFSRQEFLLKDNDCLYLLSDGFIDQFGGPDGLKFLMKRFTAKILEIHQKPMFEQKSMLEKVYEDWKSDYKQIDDVLVIGLRFSKEIRTDILNWEEKTILIAEDTDMNYFLLAEVLKKTNAKLLWVKNGSEAVEMAKTNHIDLVLMDINMPTMDGFEATKLIKEFKKEIPIIIQTAIHEDGYEKSMEIGADDFISKPIDLKTFMEKIARFLN